MVITIALTLLINSTTITIASVGDIMMGTTYPDTFLPPAQGQYLFREASPYFKQADIVFGNLEGTLCNEGIPRKKAKRGKVYLFRTPPSFAKNLKDAGFTVMSLANNHTLDFGLAGLDSTKEALKSMGIGYVTKYGDVFTTQINGLTVKFLGFSTGPPPGSILYPQKPLAQIEAISKECDILVVSVHGGGEGRDFLHTKDEEETFLGEKRGNLVKFARSAIDNGADVVLCHGPHVPRAMEVYKEKLIVYSLGNFCTYGGMKLTGEAGLAPLVIIEVDGKGVFVKGRVISFIQYPPGGPRLDRKGKALKLIQTLSTQDFPESSPVFSGEDFFPH